MQEVLNKLNELVKVLQEEISRVKKTSSELKEKEVMLDSIITKQLETNIDLDKREKALSSKESAEDILKSAKENQKKAVDANLANQQKAKDLDVLVKSNEKESADLQMLVSVYKNKLASVDAQQIALNEEKKNLRKIILDEIKGKL
jgi:hypothetical protein